MHVNSIISNLSGDCVRAFDACQSRKRVSPSDWIVKGTFGRAAMKTTFQLLLVGALAAAGTLASAQAAERTGEQVVKAQCLACHQAGLHGAPRIDDRNAWIPRMKKGVDATVRTAMKGHGAMPARGGLAELSDAELKAAVLYLFNPAGVPPRPPPAQAPGPNEKIVDGTEVYLGVIPTPSGVHHVNITLRDSTTHAVIEDAQVEVKVANPVMGSETRKLNRIVINKVVSYGHDFRMTGKEPHAITVLIRRPNSPRVIETRFEYKG